MEVAGEKIVPDCDGKLQKCLWIAGEKRGLYVVGNKEVGPDQQGAVKQITQQSLNTHGK